MAYGVEAESSDSQSSTELAYFTGAAHRTAGQRHDHEPVVVVKEPPVSDIAPSLGQKEQMLCCYGSVSLVQGFPVFLRMRNIL